MNRTRRTLAALVVVAALLSMVAALGQARPSGATVKTGSRPRAVVQSTDPRVSPFFTVTADKTTGLRDGDIVHFTLTTRPGVHVDPTSVGGNIVRECAGSTATEADLTDHTKCSTTEQSATMPNNSGNVYWFADGSKAIGSMVVGVGDAVDPNNASAVVTCDAMHACRLVLSGDATINGKSNQSLFDASTILTFASTTSSVGGCNGLASNPIVSAAPDRLGDVWAKWQSSECVAGKTPGKAESTTVSFPDGGEAKAMDSFSTGAADLAYSAVGPDTAGFTPSKSRPYVAIPIGLNASVLSLAGGHAPTADNPIPGIPLRFPQPFTNVEMTIPEIADFVSRGPVWSLTKNDFVGRNPALKNPITDGLDFSAKAYTPSGPNALSLFSSSAFVARAAAQWRTAAAEGDTARSVITNFALATPGFSANVTNGYSAKSALGKPVWNAINNWNSGDVLHTMWLLSDFATANAEGTNAVHVQTGKGDFVAPTAASIQAAVPTMQTAKDGMLRPNPAASADHSGAYPLSFVEYAIAPAQPLVTGTCTLRTNSQQMLTDWLTYITTTGQSNLADGLVPLTPALQQQAADAIAKVGKSPTTGACAGKVKGPNGKPIGGAAGKGAGGFGAGGGAGGFGAGGAGGFGANGAGLDNAAPGGSGLGGASTNPLAETSAGALGIHATKPSTAASRRQAQQAADQASIKMPSFLGATPISALIPPVSLLLITLITYIAGLGTSGRPLELPQFGRRRRQAAGGPRLGWLRRLPSAQ